MINAIEIYNSNGETQIDVTFEHETVWLSLNQIAKLFGRDKSVISRHLKIFMLKKNSLGLQLLQKMQQFKWKAKDK